MAQLLHWSSHHISPNRSCGFNDLDIRLLVQQNFLIHQNARDQLAILLAILPEVISNSAFPWVLGKKSRRSVDHIEPQNALHFVPHNRLCCLPFINLYFQQSIVRKGRFLLLHIPKLLIIFTSKCFLTCSQEPPPPFLLYMYMECYQIP